ncbi:DUF2059 domain-containing protein [Acinetobacter sp. WCHAc060025]|uniref:DUF2059 domain-containing protein n=2 Tax=Moraxellaceae TaxID=468 RepID=A0A3G2T7D0_9GAMM|nr:DUF2059 domain-containing protein [Acinetobacter wuhouensis]RZG47556.1 DUF2059 domain-containing protein [Acinetobacter wuhouensis]RZG74982.1 DUF2059 domain-containing protein [Acinetobacter wuhouensis]RZG77585.1 DUF2059 domain-containing protein [Acinetobacter sp. WCHAc060025]
MLFTCFIWGIQSTAFATVATDKSVDKLIQLSNISEIFKQSTRDMQPYFDEQAEDLVRQITGAQTLNIEQQNAVLQISALYTEVQQNLVTNPEFTDMFKALFKKTFTEEEVQANIAFLSTPLGQSINNKTNSLMTEILQETTLFSQKQMLKPENQKVLKAKMEAILKPILPTQP